MSNIDNAQISGRIITPFVFKDEQAVSLTQETLSVIGTASGGPAFVPQQVVSFKKSDSILNSWENIFGEFNSQSEDLGPITSNIWMNNTGNQLTYTRVLGIGDGNGLNENGKYNHAGFVVGDNPLSGSINLKDANVVTDFEYTFRITFNSKPFNSDYILIKTEDINDTTKYFKFIFNRNVNSITINEGNDLGSNIDDPYTISIGISNDNYIQQFIRALRGLNESDQGQLALSQTSLNITDYFTNPELVNNTVKVNFIKRDEIRNKEINFLINSDTENTIVINGPNTNFSNSLLSQTEKMSNSNASVERATIKFNNNIENMIHAQSATATATIRQEWTGFDKISGLFGTYITISDSYNVIKNYILVDTNNDLLLSTGDIINGSEEGNLGTYDLSSQNHGSPEYNIVHLNRQNYNGFVAVVVNLNNASTVYPNFKGYKNIITQLKSAIEHVNGHNNSINVGQIITTEVIKYSVEFTKDVYSIELTQDIPGELGNTNISVTRNLDEDPYNPLTSNIAFYGSDVGFTGGRDDNRLIFKIKDIFGNNKNFRLDTESNISSDGTGNIDYNIGVQGKNNTQIKDEVLSVIQDKIDTNIFSYNNNLKSISVSDSSVDSEISLKIESLLKGFVKDNIVSQISPDVDNQIINLTKGSDGTNSQITFSFTAPPEEGDSFTLKTIDPDDNTSLSIEFQFELSPNTINGNWDSQNRIVSVLTNDNIPDVLTNIKNAIDSQGASKGNVKDKYEVLIDHNNNSITIIRDDEDDDKNFGFVFDQDVDFILRRSSLVKGRSETPIQGLFGDQTFTLEKQNIYSTYTVRGGLQGKTHFFGSVYEDIDFEDYISPYDDYIEQITGDQSINKIGIVTDVVFATSGSVFHLQDDDLDDLKIDEIHNELTTKNSFSEINFGSKSSKLKNPKIYIQGQNEEDKTIISKTNKTNLYNKSNLFESLFNTTPEYYLYKGNLNYSSFRNTSPLFEASLDNEIKHFVATGKNFWNEEINSSNGEEIVNYESFESIYQKARTPWIVSQPVYKEDGYRENMSKYCKRLFRLHTYSDGKKGNKYRFRIKPRRLGKSFSRDVKESWSIFDLIVYKYNYLKNSFDKIIDFVDLDLNPKSVNYIGKKIGSEREYYDLDKKEIIHEGFYKKTNNHIFVEIEDDVEYMVNESTLIPSGFSPYPHMNIDKNKLSLSDDISGISNVIHNPLIYVGNRKINKVENNNINYDLSESHWGVLFDKTKSVKIENISLLGESQIYNFEFNKFVNSSSNEYHFYHNYTKYFQNFRENKFWITPLEDTVEDTHNDFFHLEKILYLPQEETINEKWNYSFYRRDAKDVSDMSKIPSAFKYININEVLQSESEADSPNSKFLSFDFFSFGGFDGINILDEYKRKMSNESCLREYDQEILSETKGQTSYAYETAKNIALDIDNFRCDVFYIPGISHPGLVSDIIDKANDSSKFTYVFDSNEYDESNNLIKDSYYFNNTDRNVNDLLDERDSIKSSIILGTNNSFNRQTQRFFNSRYSINLLNRCEAVINDSIIEIPSSLVFINSLSQTSSINQSIDSVDYNNNIITIANIVNSKFIYNNNEFDNLLIDSKKKETNINPIGVISSNKKIKPLSSNTLVQDRKSIFSRYHNVRIILDIKRNLKNLLISSPVIGDDTVLFSLNSNNNPSFNLKGQVSLIIEQFLQTYVDRRIIKEFYVDLSLSELNSKSSIKDNLENTLSGAIGLSLYDNSSNEDFLININLNNLLNDINDFTEENNVNIININR